ncbi:hypothetical protein D7D52_08385 [Nocardia yunnanensis]|uniref:DUF3558 domain-containing protein n=2 Tax=Nocardia yunnanensis TaxID=2382165 RepID=A0A386ZBJ6_9NOCA|nr:hypothetical protein D7D52_08385 [Nocardia yunnanensis]
MASIATLFFVAGIAVGCDSDTDSPAAVPPIGDVTTLDPCGFITPTTFTDLKTVGAAITIEPADFVRCNLNLPLIGQDQGRIAVWTILGPHTADLASSDAVSTDRGPIHITKGTSENGAWCDATVRLADGAGVLLHASADQNGRKLTDVDPCPARDRAVDAIVATMKSGAYKRIAYPSDSLHGYDLCGSISLSEVETAVNLTDLTDKSTPAQQNCQWRGSDGSDTPPGAMVSVMISDPNLFMGKRSTINGFPSRVWDISQTSGSGRCVITTTTKRWDTWPGQYRSNSGGTISELLYTQVILPTQSESGQACRAATSVATQALSHRSPN